MPTSELDALAGWVSVTEVLEYFPEPELVDWRIDTGRKESSRISRQTARLGTRVHEIIAGTSKLGKKDSVEVRNCIEAWQRFKHDYQPEIIAQEIEVRDYVCKVIGHIDMVAKIMDSLVIIDWKTGGRINKKHLIQAAKYQQMAMQQYPKAATAIVRLDKNLGSYEFKQQDTDNSFLVQVFDAMLLAYRHFTDKPQWGITA